MYIQSEVFSRLSMSSWETNLCHTACLKSYAELYQKKSFMLSIFLPSKCWGSFRNRSRNGEPHVCQEWGIIWIRRSPNSELYCSFPQRLDCLTGWEVTDEARTCRGLARTGNMAAWRSINLLFPRKEKESLSFFWLVAGSCSSSRALIGW